MNSIPNPDSWMDVATILIAVAMMTVPSWFAMKAHKSSEQVRNQVQNGHKTPMRADLDRAIGAIDQLGTELSGLRRDLADEENRRRNHVQDVYASLQALREDVDHKLSDLNNRFG